MRRCAADGTILAEVPYSDLWEGREVRAIRRATLAELLVGRLPDECLLLGRAVRNVRPARDGADVRSSA